MKKFITALILSFIFHLLAFQLIAQVNQSFIYGTLTTYDGEVYTGQIRWGDEEAFWTDHFDAVKLYNDHIEHLSEKEINSLAERKIDSWGVNYDGNARAKEEAKRKISFVHQLSCQFGEMKRLDIKRIDKVEVTFRDGNRYRVSGEGYNDIGTEIVIYDQQKGEIELDWLEVLHIEFKAPPADFQSAIGQPVYGTVKTNDGEYSGYIQWDKDERVSTDALDGDDQEGRQKIEFAKIASISKYGNGSRVRLFSGKEYILKGTNDVNDQNRGIIICNPDFGRVMIEWSDFIEVNFRQDIPDIGMAYNAFKVPSQIAGEVHTIDGKVVKGKIVFDLDEQFDFEILNGDMGDKEFSIPFRNISKIVPSGSKGSVITLKSKKELKLTSSQDVNSKNDGLLLFVGDENPVYIGWDELEAIILN